MTTQHIASLTRDTAIAYLMKNYANYNLWANTTLVNWLKTKPAALLEQTVPSSFPSIKLTLLHIWQTERYWLSIIKKEEIIKSHKKQEEEIVQEDSKKNYSELDESGFPSYCTQVLKGF